MDTLVWWLLRTNLLGAGTVTQQENPLLASIGWCPGSCPSCSIPTQLPDGGLGKHWRMAQSHEPLHHPGG